MVNILKAARPLNLLIILVAQILTSYFLGFKNSWPIVFDLMHSSIYLTSILAAAFGYVFNDYMDVKADGINRPTAHYLANLPIEVGLYSLPSFQLLWPLALVLYMILN